MSEKLSSCSWYFFQAARQPEQEVHVILGTCLESLYRKLQKLCLAFLSKSHPCIGYASLDLPLPHHISVPYCISLRFVVVVRAIQAYHNKTIIFNLIRYVNCVYLMFTLRLLYRLNNTFENVMAVNLQENENESLAYFFSV